jgi:hypothetical protein
LHDTEHEASPPEQHNGSEASLFLVYINEGNPQDDGPLLMTDRGLIVKKDLMAGGFLNSGQGTLWLNYGLVGRPTLSSAPAIQLMSSGVDYPSDTSFVTDPRGWEVGQLFHLTSDYYWNGRTYPDGMYRWNGEDWIKEDYTGKYDTLYLCQSSLLTPGHLDLGDLNVHGKLMLKSANSTFAVAAGDNFDPEHPQNPFDTYLIPQNPTNGGLGLGTYAFPFKWVDATRVFTDEVVALSGGSIKFSFNSSASARSNSLRMQADTIEASALDEDTLVSAVVIDNDEVAGLKQKHLNGLVDEWYSDDEETLKATVDGSTGNITAAGLTVSGNTNIAGYAKFNNDAKLVWVNTSTLAVQDASGVTANGGLDVGSVFVNSLQPLNSGSPAGININCPLSIGGSRGSSSQVLTSSGSGSAPTWQNIPVWNGGIVTNNITINKNAGVLKFTGNYPYIEWLDSQWGASAYLQSGVTSVGGVGGNYLLLQLPSGKNFGVSTGGSLTLALDSAGNLTPSGALNLSVNKWIQWGNDTRLYQSDSGVIKVQQLVGGNWDLGTLDASNIYVDHIAPASGESLYFLGAPSNFELNWVNSSPVACRLFFGDGSGWQLNFARGNSSTYSDLFTFLDTGALCFKTNGQVRLYNSANSVLQVQNSSGGLGTLDVSSLFVDYLNAASQGGIIYLYSSINPTSANVYNLGNSGAYYGSIWANYLKYHTEHSAFDSLDDLALVKAYTTKIVTKKNPITLQEYTEKVIDPVSISFLQDENGFYDPSRSIGFVLGCSKALAKKDDEQDDTLIQILDKIESQQKTIEDIALKVQELISNGGASD